MLTMQDMDIFRMITGSSPSTSKRWVSPSLVRMSSSTSNEPSAALNGGGNAKRGPEAALYFIYACTARINWSLRSYSFLNNPNDAKPGLKSTTSPGAAASKASLTASITLQYIVVFGSSFFIRSVPVPSSNKTFFECSAMARNSGAVSSPLSAPPAIRTTFLSNDLRAATVASGVVALLSLYTAQPFFSVSSWSLPSTDSNDSSPALIFFSATPSARNAAAARAAFSRLCSPRNLNFHSLGRAGGTTGVTGGRAPSTQLRTSSRTNSVSPSFSV